MTKQENNSSTIFSDCSYFSGIFTPKHEYVSGEYALTYLQNVKTKLDRMNLYSKIKILKLNDKMGKMILIVK